jgi:SPP1 family predicted phage head-tail adaptor
MIRAGRLRHKILLQRKAMTTDDYGGPVETWTDFSTPWASVEPLSGRELANAQAVNAETTTKITMRYLAGVTAADRIIFEGRFYNIQSVIDEEMRHRQLVILASEGLNEG